MASPTHRTHADRPSRSGQDHCRFIPVAVSETQPTDCNGRTICKVIGCSEVDYSFTGGYCKNHYVHFSQKSTLNHIDGKISEDHRTDSWTCDCGEVSLSTKKRCRACFRWKGGKKCSSGEGRNILARDKTVSKTKRMKRIESYVNVDNTLKRKNSGDVSAGKFTGEKKSTKLRRDSESKHVVNNEALEVESDNSIIGGGSTAPKPKLKTNKSKVVNRRKQRRHDNQSSVANASAGFDAEITELRTAKQCAQRWNALLTVKNNRKTCHVSISRSEESHLQNGPNVSDPFDCSDLIVPPISRMVEQEATQAIQRWKDLDSRIVAGDVGSTAFFEDILESNSDGRHSGDLFFGDEGRQQRLLPPNFDYQCKSKPADDFGGSHSVDRPRVVSLWDPTETLDYETQLWHVFNSMPKTSEVLEQKNRLHGNAVSNRKDENHSPIGCQHTLGAKNFLKISLPKHTRMDSHALGRLRVRDRHAAPTRTDSHSLIDNCDLDQVEQDIKMNAPYDTSIRFDVLRYSVDLKRGSSRDANRLEVELSGSHHTLLDFHRVLVECAYTADDRMIHWEGDDSLPGGVFLMESNLFHFGVAGEAARCKILNWLDEDQATLRREHLCISSCTDSVPMAEILLENVPLRLGVRYVHIIIESQPLHCNSLSLRNESALFVTGIQTQTRESKKKFWVPIIHDIWTPSKQTTCEACNSAVATVVITNDMLTDISSSVTTGNVLNKQASGVDFQGTPLCAGCFRALYYRPTVSEDDTELHLNSGNESLKVMPIDDFNRLSFDKATEGIPGNSNF